MGSYAFLKIGSLTLDETKSAFPPEYLFLFQASDKTEDDFVTESDEVVAWALFSRSLRDVCKRLELLGYSLARVQEFISFIIANETSMSSFADERPEVSESPRSLRPADFVKAVTQIDLTRERPSKPHGLMNYIPYAISDESEAIAALEGSAVDPELTRSIASRLGPFAILRLLAENPTNLAQAVVLDIGELVLNEYMRIEDLKVLLPRERQFLIVAEGASDARILRKAFELRRAPVADFFYYIDVSEGYPFSGTGNLYNFCKGLVAIGVLNRTIVVYDNDAAGVISYRDNKDLNLPTNIAIMKLPDLSNGNMLRAIGPNGVAPADINGRAASIECYLDLTHSETEPLIRWRSYEKRVNDYQGELENKQRFEERFLQLGVGDDYEFSKIERCLEEIIAVASAMASKMLTQPEPEYYSD